MTPDPNILVAVLAAGRSSRFGAPKLLQPWKNKPIVKHATDAAIEVFPKQTYIVTGANRSKVIAASGLPNCREIYNPDYRRGIGSSISAAAKYGDANCTGLFILLADQALIQSKHLQALACTWRGGDAQIIATEFGETTGPPVLFGRSYFEELRTLDDDHGARRVIRDNYDSLTAIRFEDASIDIDTVEDFAKLADS